MYFDSMGFEIFGQYIHWYGVIIAFGMVLAVLLGIKLFKKRNLSTGTLIDLALIAIPSAIIGARLYYVIFYTNTYTFWQIFEIWNGGLAIYGGVIGGFIGILIYCLIKKINLIDVCDCAASCLILGQAIGRWGNFTNGEAYGNLITNTDLQFFPFGVLIPSGHFTSEATQAVISAFGSVPTEAWFMATFFYESMWNFLVFGVLLLVFYKFKVKGLTTCVYFALYGLGRFFIEALRMDSLYFGPFKVSQLLSLILLIVFTTIGIILVVKSIKKSKLQKADNQNNDEGVPNHNVNVTLKKDIVKGDTNKKNQKVVNSNSEGGNKNEV